MAVISGDHVIGLRDQLKNLLGRGDMQGLPAVDFAQRAPLKLLVQALDGVGGPDGLPLIAREAREGEELVARFFQAVGDRPVAIPTDFPRPCTMSTQQQQPRLLPDPARRCRR